MSSSTAGDADAVDAAPPADAMVSPTDQSIVSDADASGFNPPTDTTFDSADVTIDATPDATTDFSPAEPLDDANATDDADV